MLAARGHPEGVIHRWSYAARRSPEGSSLTPRSPEPPSFAGKARGAAAALSEALTAAGARSWVQAVVVVWGDMAEPHVPARSLDWVAGTEITAWLNSRPLDRIPNASHARRRWSQPGKSTSRCALGPAL